MPSNPIEYDYKEFTLATGESDYDVSDQVLELFNRIKVASHVVIRTTQDISFKFNNANLPAISLGIGESPYQPPRNFISVSNIFLTNASGATATISIWLA